MALCYLPCVLAAATGRASANAGPVHFDIPEPLVPEPDSDPTEVPPGRPDGRPWTHSPAVSFDQPLPIDLTPDTVVISGHGPACTPISRICPTVAEPTARHPATPLHPLALTLLRPRQGDYGRQAHPAPGRSQRCWPTP